MPRFLALLFFFAFLAANADCNAQRPRLFQRFHSPAPIAQPQQTLSHRPAVAPHKIELGRYSTYRNPFVSRILDGPTTPGRRDPLEVESRYVGGIHRSYFDNLGIPSGDIGLRGNAYNWNTW